MPQKSYKDRGYKVFDKNGGDLPGNPKHDEFEEILILEGRRKVAIRSKLLSRRQLGNFIKPWLSRVVIVSIIAVLIGGAYFLGSLDKHQDTISPPVLVVTATAMRLAPNVASPPKAATAGVKNSPTAFSSATFSRTKTPTATCMQVVTVLGNETIAVRRGPGTSYQQVNAAQPGSELPFLGYNNARTWIQIGQDEWVFAQLVSVPKCS